MNYFKAKNYQRGSFGEEYYYSISCFYEFLAENTLGGAQDEVINASFRMQME